MKHGNQCLQTLFVILAAVVIGCRPSPLGPEGLPSIPTIEGSRPIGHVRQPYGHRTDNFDRPNSALFEVKAPHKIEGGMLHLQASQEGTILRLSTNATPTVITAQVIPPGIGEHVGLAFVQSEGTSGLFYLYRPVGAPPLVKRCNIGVSVRISGREVRDPDIRVRDIDFQPDTPIKLAVRGSGPTVFLSINDQEIGRIHDPRLKGGAVGVYGKSQHPDGSIAIAKFDSVQTYDLR